MVTSIYITLDISSYDIYIITLYPGLEGTTVECKLEKRSLLVDGGTLHRPVVLLG
jgi:hypothetical protein